MKNQNRFIDETGKKFNKLTCIKFSSRGNNTNYWLCKCDCGNDVILDIHSVKSGHTKSCGCIPNRTYEDLTNQRFGRLIAKFFKKINNKIWWCCICDCGTEIIVRAASLKNGDTKSCGCYKKERDKSQKGKNSPRWRHDLSKKEREEDKNRSKCPKNTKWRKKVFERDKYTCQCCGDNKGGNLESHHIYSYRSHKNLRYVTSNGITLCKQCHKDFHKTYTYFNNTRKQLNEFLKSKEQPDFCPEMVEFST